MVLHLGWLCSLPLIVVVGPESLGAGSSKDSYDIMGLEH